MSYAPSPLPSGTLPNFRTTRLLGIFNILFASFLLIAGLCMGASLAVQPMVIKAMNDVQKKAEENIAAAKKTELDALAKRAEAAKTDQEKAQIDADRKEIEEAPKVGVPMFDFSKLINQPILQGWYWVEILSGLFVNVVLLVSGIGLLQYRGWARKLGIWTSLLKLARLALVYGFFIIAVVPPMSKTIGEFVSQMMVQQQGIVVKGPRGVPDAQMLTKIYSITYSIMGAGVIGIGSIYPAVMLFFLTRPRVKAACDGARKSVNSRDEL